MPEFYVSVDVEADGPIPGPNSMLSFGAAAYTADGLCLGTFTRNLKLLNEATPDPDTMIWWQSTPENQQAYLATQEHQADPVPAMHDFVMWVETLKSQTGDKPVMVGYPIAYDFMWIHWYLMRFKGYTPFSHSGLDMKTVAMVLLNVHYRNVGKRMMLKHWKPKTGKHTHVALDDAIEQGEMFCQMLQQVHFRNKLQGV